MATAYDKKLVNRNSFKLTHLENIRKPYAFPMFSGGRERVHYRLMILNVNKLSRICVYLFCIVYLYSIEIQKSGNKRD